MSRSGSGWCGAGKGAEATPLRRGATHWAGEPVQVWERRWEVPRVEVHDTLGSTNDRLRAMAREGASSFTVVLAEEQTEGRGRSGSPWYSPPGRGVWMSVLLPGESPGRTPLVPLLVGVAVCRAVRDVLPGLRPGVKWPNDVLVQGRKVCGILCESEGGATVAGIGINALGGRAELPSEIRERATTLAEEGREIRRSELVGAVLHRIRELTTEPPVEIRGELAVELSELDVLRGRRVRTDDGTSGLAVGVAPDGALRVRTGDGRELRIVAGSVAAEGILGASNGGGAG